MSAANGNGTTMKKGGGLELSNEKINELMKEIDPRITVHPQVEEFLMELADEFLDQVASFSAQLAKHRRSTVLEAKDVQFCLKKNWNIHIHGMDPNLSSKKENQEEKPQIIKGKGSIHSQRLDIKKHVLAKTSRTGKSKKRRDSNTKRIKSNN